MTIQIYKFEAKWCGPCRKFKEVFNSVMAKHGDIQSTVVDVDDEPELAEKYGIMSVPALVAVSDGNVIATTIGSKSESAFEAWINGLTHKV